MDVYIRIQNEWYSKRNLPEELPKGLKDDLLSIMETQETTDHVKEGVEVVEYTDNNYRIDFTISNEDYHDIILNKWESTQKQ